MTQTFDEPRVRRALLRIRGKGTVGTGFFFDESGLVMTCHHVVDGADAITVEDASGQTLPATLVEEMSAADVDFAVLRVDARAPMVLPLGVAPTQPEKVWISGFQLQSANLRGPLPTVPMLEGSAEIEYRHRREYKLRNVLRLGGGIVSAGISGAPVVVMPEGVAIGITTADFDHGGGFAVPVMHAIEQSEPLREHARRLEESVPSYGRYLNTAAARLLCAKQVERALAFMSDRAQFLPDKYIERRKLSEALREFRESPAKIFPVIGISGVGKTNTLAGIARTAQPDVFLAAHRAKFDDRGLAETLAAELSQDAPAPVDPEKLVEALARPASRLLVILDGLNEAQALAQANGRAWLEDTFAWLKNRPVQLVVTSRPEFWSLIADQFPSSLLVQESDKSARAESPAFELPSFDDDELHAAAAAYHLTPGAADDTALRHPLLIRLYWELGARGGHAGMYALFERFVENRSKRVSTVLGGTVSPTTVQHALAVAARLADPKTLAIPTSRLIEDLAALSNVREALISENLLVESADGYRFLFDELADFLMAHERELPHGLGAWRALLDQRAQRTGWIRFALLRLERTMPNKFANELRTVATAYEQGAGGDIEALLQQTILAAGDPKALAPVVLQFARAVAARKRNELTVNFGELADRTGLSAPERLEIARHFLPNQHYYDWEEKHWRDLTTRQFYGQLRPWRRSHTAPAIVAGALDVDYEAAVPVLMTWLADETGLREGRGISRISDIARAFLFHTRDMDFDFLCSQVAEGAISSLTGARYLLGLVATYDGESMLPFLEAWAEHDDPRYSEIATYVLSVAKWSSASEEWTLRAERVLERILQRRVSESAVASALSIASSRPRLTSSAFDELLSRFLRDDWNVTGYALRPYVATHTDTLLHELETYLDGAHSPARRGDAIYAVGAAPLSSATLVKIAGFLSRMLSKHNDLGYQIARVVEDVLYEVKAPSQACDDFLALAKRILLECGEGPRTAALYGIIATGEGREKNALKEALIDDLCTGAYPRELQELLLHQLADSRHDSDAQMERIHKLAARVDGQTDGTSLMKSAFSDDRFANRLAEWLATREVRRGSPAERFLERVRSGRKPADAADDEL